MMFIGAVQRAEIEGGVVSHHVLRRFAVNLVSVGNAMDCIRLPVGWSFPESNSTTLLPHWIIFTSSEHQPKNAVDLGTYSLYFPNDKQDTSSCYGFKERRVIQTSYSVMFYWDLLQEIISSLGSSKFQTTGPRGQKLILETTTTTSMTRTWLGTSRFSRSQGKSSAFVSNRPDKTSWIPLSWKSLELFAKNGHRSFDCRDPSNSILSEKIIQNLTFIVTTVHWCFAVAKHGKAEEKLRRSRSFRNNHHPREILTRNPRRPRSSRNNRKRRKIAKTKFGR